MKVAMKSSLVTIAAIAAIAVIAAIGPATAATPPPSGQFVPAQEISTPVDVNCATADELVEVPGIGPSTAARIIEWRETQGRFERLEDLLNIRGIGVTTLEKLRPFLTVGGRDEGRGAGL